MGVRRKIMTRRQDLWITQDCSDDIMILDTGEQVFLWMGPRCSEVEIKLAYKSAQVYIQNLRAKQPEKPRRLFLTIKGKESKRFTRCFHGWGAMRTIPN